MLFGRNDTIFTHPGSTASQAIEHPRFATNRDLYFFRIFKELLQPVDSRRVECSTLRSKPQRSTFNSGVENGGGERDRTDDLLLAKQALSQLSYTPDKKLVGLDGFEPSTPALSRRCSNQLSYKPTIRTAQGRGFIACSDLDSCFAEQPISVDTRP